MVHTSVIARSGRTLYICRSMLGSSSPSSCATFCHAFCCSCLVLTITLSKLKIMPYASSGRIACRIRLAPCTFRRSLSVSTSRCKGCAPILNSTKPWKYRQQIHTSLDHNSTTAKVGSEHDAYLGRTCLCYPPHRTQTQFCQNPPSFSVPAQLQLCAFACWLCLAGLPENSRPGTPRTSGNVC